MHAGPTSLRRGWFSSGYGTRSDPFTDQPTLHPGVDFAVDLVSARIEYAYSTKLVLSGWLQYNDATGDFVSNLRLNFIHSPLSDLFLVYQERRDTDSGAVLDRRITAKLTKLFAF